MLPVPDAARAEDNDVDRHANLAVAAHVKAIDQPGRAVHVDVSTGQRLEPDRHPAAGTDVSSPEF